MSPEQQSRYPNRPLKPAELLEAKLETFPDEVFIAVNGLIAERLQGQYARFSVKALHKRMVELGLNKKEVQEKGWDNIGSIYKQEGWDVTYHSSSDDDFDFDPYYFFNTNGPRSW